MKAPLPGTLLLAILLWPWNVLPATDWSALATALDEIRIEGQVPAMGLAILDGGQPVLVRTFGSAGQHTPFRWGSISKSFTALGALQLAYDQQIELSRPLRSLLNGQYYQNAWARTDPLRLEHLLELTAGFADLKGGEFNDNTPRPLNEALTRNAGSRATLWPPGLQHSYSNLPPGLTAAFIERVSGKSFERFMAQRTFASLGMSGAGFEPLPDLPGGFRADGRTPIPYWHMTFRAFGGLNASLPEMAGFAAVLLNGGRHGADQVLAEAVFEDLFRSTGSLGAQAGLEVTYARGIYAWVRGGHIFWGHGGDADGYLSRYGLLREHQRGYLLVINTDNPPLFGKLRRKLEDALLDGLAAHPAPASVEQQHPELNQYAGSYYPASVRFGRDRWVRGAAPGAEVRVDGNALSFHRGQRSTRLTPLGGGRFVRPGDPAVTVVFVRDPAGTLYMQGELGNFVNLSAGPCPGFLASCE